VFLNFLLHYLLAAKPILFFYIKLKYYGLLRFDLILQLDLNINFVLPYLFESFTKT